MKKYLLLLSSAALLLVGCAKEQIVNQQKGELTNVTFTANLDNGVATKALADGDGAAANVNRCIMEIYYGDDEELYTRQYAPVNSDKKASFTVQVPSNRTYTVAFWADKVDDATTGDGLAVDKYYTTTSLKSISIKGSYIGNDDARDAFFHFGRYIVAQAGSSWGEIKLTRPFAQMNVITTDWDKAAKVSGLAPEKVKVTIKNALVNFNAVTGKASGSGNLEYETAVYTAPAPENPVSETVKTLSMDYLFASNDKAVIDIDWKALHGADANVEHAFAAVPYQRNYRTNIKGALLTTQGQWTVTVESTWTTPEYNPEFVQEGSVEAANKALEEGKTAINITNPADASTPVVMPAATNGKEISINVTGASASDMTFKTADGADGPAELSISTDLSDKNLTIDCPKSHVEVNKGAYNTIEATTSANTLVIGKDVTVATLEINGGNAKIYGLVNTIEKQTSTVVDFYVGTAAGLRSVAEKISAAPGNKDFYGKVYLTADINLNNEEWTPIAAFQKPLYIDGQGHTIKNLKVTESTIDYIGFIGTACGLTVKNLNFDTVTLSYPSSVGEDARGGVIAGHVWGATVENCIVKNVDITACQKVGGLIGYVEGDTSVPHSIKNCSVEKVSIKSNDPAKILQHGAGGFIGHISLSKNPLISISGCSVKDVTIANFGLEDKEYEPCDPNVDKKYGDMQRVPHVFIGNVCNSYSGEDASISAHSVVLSNTTISGTNTVLPTCMYSSEYFGWAGNPEERPAWKGGIYIDGQEWTPNYPVKIVGGKGYATLDAALAAATADQTVQILKAGDYTVQTLSTNAAVVEATVDGVVFNHTPKSGEGQNWVSAQTDNVKTVKNITWNVGNGGHYPYFSNTNLENCTVNGMLCTHLTNKFKDCTFINEEGYNFWVYGNKYTEFDNCTFTCPGKNDGVAGCGSALNCYNEGDKTPTPVLVVKNCTFTAKEASNKYSAIYIKDKPAFDIRITNSTCNDNFCTGAISGSKLWNLKSDREGTTVSIDGNMVYPFSMDANGNYGVTNPFGLKMAIKHWNALKAAGEKSITLADGAYNVSDMAIFQNYTDKSLLIKAENEKRAVITPTSGSKQLIFVVAGMSKSYAGHITVDGIKFDFSNADKTIESDVISISDAAGTNLPADEKALYSGSYHYGHDITVKNCEIIGLGIVDKDDEDKINAIENCSVVRTENQNGYNVKVQNCVIDKVGYVLTSKITTLAEVSNCTITDVKCVINNSVDGTDYKVTGNTISNYHTYCIRINYGPLTVSGNSFTGMYTGTKSTASVVFLRGTNGNKATITGNTINKAVDTMYDVYCETSWEVDNGAVTKTIPAGKGIMDISNLNELN